VTPEAPDPLPPEAELALAWSGPKVRGALSMALQFDRRLARIVGRTQETMLGQMRLAWWREALGKPVAERPRGDAVLDGIGAHWAGREAFLAQMVDGWEALVTAETLGRAEAEAFAAGRGAFFAGLADEPAAQPAAARLAAAGQRWALADAAAAVSDPAERAMIVAAGLAVRAPQGRIGRGLGGVAVLEALALRALAAGGRPLMEGRGASLAALRAAIFRP
jgi:phytoene synthase